MGRSSRRKWERRRAIPLSKKNRSVEVQDVEQWSYGPISAVRRGRFMQMLGNWDPDEHKAFMERVKATRPQLKDEIDQKITALRDRIRPLDRLSLAGAIATALQVSSEEDFGEQSPARFSHAEYFMGLALAEPLTHEAAAPNEDDVEYIIETISDIMNHVSQYYGSEIAEKGDQGAVTELRFMMQLHTLNVRGDAYPQHTKELTLRLLKATEHVFQKHFSLTAEQIWAILEKIAHGVHERLSGHAREAMAPLFKSQAAYGKWIAEQDLTKYTSSEEVREAFMSSGLAPASDEITKFQDYMKLFGGVNAFKYEPVDANERELVDALSAEFGDNGGFTAIKNWAGWPLNPSIVYEYPFVKCQGQYFAFLVPRILSDTPHIIDRLVFRVDPEYYNTSFLEKRGKVLERYAMDLLHTALRPEGSGLALYYTPEGEGRTELDGLVVVGDALLLVEAKAGQISDAARRGAPKGLRQDVEEIVGAAFNQGQRALRYIDSAEEVPFFDEKGTEVLRIRSSNFRHRFVVNVTMSPLYVLGTALPKLKDIGALSGRDWPWAVYICDLAAIVDLTTHPTMLLHYIQRRLEANKPALSVMDELDLYGHYVAEGLFFGQGELDDSDAHVTFTGYTEAIDDYMFYKAGLKSKRVPKPVQKLPQVLELILSTLETLKPAGYVTAALSLLDWDGASRDALATQVARVERKYLQDKKAHSVTVTFDDSVLCFAVGASLTSESEFNSWAQKWFSQGKTRAAMLSWTGQLKNTTQLAFRSAREERQA